MARRNAEVVKQPYRIFVVSKGERFHTFAWLNALGLDYTTICHTAEQRQRLREHVDGRRVVATNLPTLLDQRNYILDRVKEGEWYVGMDDNIRTFTELEAPFRNQQKLDIMGTRPAPGRSWASAFNHPVTAARLTYLFRMVAGQCDALGTVYGGFASADVPLYRGKMWSYMRFVKSKLFLMKKVPGLCWGGGGDVAHDSWMSVYCAYTYGAVAVYNYGHPVHKMYEGGGIGSLEARRARLEVELKKIIEQFPGMVRRATGPNAALAFTARFNPKKDK